MYPQRVHEDPDFEAVFHQFRPIDVIGELTTGSRPASRGGKAVADLRPIPRVFARGVGHDPRRPPPAGETERRARTGRWRALLI